MRRASKKEECFVVYYQNIPYAGPYISIGPAKQEITRLIRTPHYRRGGYREEDFEIIRYTPERKRGNSFEL